MEMKDTGGVGMPPGVGWEVWKLGNGELERRSWSGLGIA